MNKPILASSPRPRRALALSLLLTLGAGAPLAADTIHVAPCGDDSWTGLSPICAAPDGPKRTIQAAIDISMEGDLVLLADGTYTGPGNRDISYGGRGITVRSAGDDPALCIVDCQASTADPHRGFVFQSGETSLSILRGITIRNGVVERGAGVWILNQSNPQVIKCIFAHNTAETATTGGSGAGVRIEGSSPRLVDCWFIENEAVRLNLFGFGGAVRITGDSSPELINCRFERNSAFQGGAVDMQAGSAATFRDCLFDQNTASNNGGALSSVQAAGLTMEDCILSGNMATSPLENGGAGVAITGGGMSTITRCTFTANQSARIGGGLWLTQGANGEIVSCTFRGNAAGFGAGALAVTSGSAGTVVNCLLTENTGAPGAPGGAVWVGDGTGVSAFAQIRNCTFAQNTTLAPIGGGALGVTQTSTVIVANCILWDNSPGQITLAGSPLLTVTNSTVQGGWPGNQDFDPLFAHPSGCEYSLQPGSPCIDAGDNTAVPPTITTDLCGNPRFVSLGQPAGAGAVDMGAYEFQGGACYPNCDNSTMPPILNVADFGCFLGKFAAADPYANCDGSTTPPVLNVADFGCFLQQFAAGCR